MAGPRLLDKGYKFWPERGDQIGLQEIVHLYESGFAGAFREPEEEEKFAEEIAAQDGGFVNAEDACHANGLAESGAGKLVAPFVWILHNFHKSLPGPAQQRGDCFPAGTMVRMADGSQKAIEDIRVRESVLTHTGKSREVIDTIRKPYDGDLVSVYAGGSRVTATPDHKIFCLVAPDHEWKRIDSLASGQYLGPKQPVESVESQIFSGDVYCLGVEEDHSFVANGIAVHNCVSHGEKNAALLTLAAEIPGGKPDEVTGKLEGIPDMPEAGIRNGVLSSEWLYWWRGYNGDGWSCSASARVATSKGIWLRKPYPELNVDTTEYSGRLAGKYGSRRPPDSYLKVGQEHLVRTATNINSLEALRDLLHNGYGVNGCGGEGFSSTRQEWGISSRRGGWAHAMGEFGVDDRSVVKQKFGEPLVLIQNSWGIWNRGPRDIYQSASLVPPHYKDLWIQLGIVNPETGNIMIPHGSFWAKWSDVRPHSRHALSSVNGWPRKKLPDWNVAGAIG